ncbi:MAG: hypothetical protein PHO26_08115 [Dehalococcoidia bacterium]|nr:hypothetical protein [Dehalococcoidia bacterium]MDD5494124.1 hypothetical protein [Dehalococcoidia bacterium]
MSFKAETYTNDAEGVSFQYPKGWLVISPVDNPKNQVFQLKSEDSTTANGMSFDVLADGDFAAVCKKAIEESPTYIKYKAVANQDSSSTAKLADGKTDAYVAEFSSVIAIYDVYLYCFGIKKNGKVIAMIGSTVGGKKDKDLIKEIAQTLAVK